MILASHSAKSQTIEVTLNKENPSFSGKPFGDLSAFPIVITDDVSGVKALLDWDRDLSEFILDIDGEPFENFVYLDPSFSLEDTETKTIQAKISINDKIITDGSGIEWLPHVV